VYCTSYMWMTVNSPLRYTIHSWSANILAIRNSGFPPTELWVTYTLIDTSFHWVACQSVNEQWHGQNRLAGGEREFPRQMLPVITSWIESWLSFCSKWPCRRYFQRLYCVAKSIIIVLWGFHQHSCVFKCIPLTKKKGENQTKQRHLLEMGAP